MEANQNDFMFSFGPIQRRHTISIFMRKKNSNERATKRREWKIFHLLTTQLLFSHESACRESGTCRCHTFFLSSSTFCTNAHVRHIRNYIIRRRVRTFLWHTIRNSNHSVAFLFHHHRFIEALLGPDYEASALGKSIWNPISAATFRCFASSQWGKKWLRVRLMVLALPCAWRHWAHTSLAFVCVFIRLTYRLEVCVNDVLIFETKSNRYLTLGTAVTLVLFLFCLFLFT